MQPTPTPAESSPSPTPPPAPAALPAGEEPCAAVKADPPAPHEEEAAAAEEDEHKEAPRRSARGRKKGRRASAAAASSSSLAAAPASSGGPAARVVMVKRELLAGCLTCPLCNRLLRDATTISECLHTFCRKCIYKKFNEEEVECCPVCKIDLGCTPTEKLRADHSLHDVRSKLFPFKRKKVKADEVPSPVSPPTKRKERSISSLVVNTDKVKPTGFTGRRTRAGARKAATALLGLVPITEDPAKKDTDACESRAQSSNLPANMGKAPQTRKQISSNPEASNDSSNKDGENNNRELTEKVELWRPLNCLVEAANITKPSCSSSQDSVAKEQLNGSSSSTIAKKTKAREHLQKSKSEDDKKEAPKRKMKAQVSRRRRELQAPADAKPDAAATENEKKFCSIWVSLVASFDQQGDPPLPQIPSHYLRIKDGSVLTSSIQKYLMQKLSLQNESEVEIKCCEQLVNPSQPLCNLVELWLKGRATQTKQTLIGSSGKEFVMVLMYGRPKAPAL